MQYPKKIVERQYELTFLVSASLTSSETNDVLAIVAKLLKKHTLTATTQQEWGKRDLAYVIKRGGVQHTQANVYHWVLDGTPEAITAFETELRLNQVLLRFLLVRATDEVNEFIVDSTASQEDASE